MTISSTQISPSFEHQNQESVEPKPASESSSSTREFRLTGCEAGEWGVSDLNDALRTQAPLSECRDWLDRQENLSRESGFLPFLRSLFFKG